jgi:hypothetical protein
MNKTCKIIIVSFFLVGIVGPVLASEYSDARSLIPASEGTNLPFVIAASSSSCVQNCKNQNKACKANCIGQGSTVCKNACKSTKAVCTAAC